MDAHTALNQCLSLTRTCLIDPSGRSGEEESKLIEYSEKRGLEIVESWKDWSLFLKIYRNRPSRSP